MSPEQRYVLWGALLGSGVATPVFASVVLILLGTQLTIGPMLGIMTGAIFGATRESLALFLSMRRRDPEYTMALLPNLRSMVRNVDASVAIGGGLVLMLLSWR